jgi:Tfp pilus assembly protein PilO
MSALDKLNLRPGERRLLVLVALVAFIVLNMFMVWPKFGELGKEQQRLADARAQLQKFQDGAAKAPIYEKRLRELEDAGSSVVSAEQALALQASVQSQAAQSGVAILSYVSAQPSGTSRTSEFFSEQGLRVTANSGDKELIDFLFKLGSGNSLIRVRDLDVKPDPSQMKLNSTISLVASYQKPTTRKNVASAKSP